MNTIIFLVRCCIQKEIVVSYLISIRIQFWRDVPHMTIIAIPGCTYGSDVSLEKGSLVFGCSHNKTKAMAIVASNQAIVRQRSSIPNLPLDPWNRDRRRITSRTVVIVASVIPYAGIHVRLLCGRESMKYHLSRLITKQLDLQAGAKR
jgi:hypothetical protein